ncbi:MAG TPA: arsenite methyltransferase [Flavitalea sp.]|nr:arsenite methyltransferase [Flavitalea sp.]
MTSRKELKELIKSRYSEIAMQPAESATGCCTAGCCGDDKTASKMADSYEFLEGYEPSADLGLGCGLPTTFAQIKKGDVVIDLGSGAGNDAFIAQHETGETGKVIGIDFSEAMIERAQSNARARNVSNVEFMLGDIENLPLADNIADVVVSNCVLNLAPDKNAVFAEIYRVLKPGGHFSISDIVLEEELPQSLSEATEMHVGCIAGAVRRDTYLELIRNNKFAKVTIQKEKTISIPGNEWMKDLSKEDIDSFQNKITSITVYAEKPEGCCSPGCCN